MNMIELGGFYYSTVKLGELNTDMRYNNYKVPDST